MAEVINYTRLTTSDKLSDRFLTCQTYNPVDPEQAQKGMLFSQIEILNPWFPTSQIGQTVINTLIREYYRGMNSSDLVNFENAVKKVNESLAQIAQNGETEWIGKFSGVLILVNGNEAHFAQSGMSHAYLYRGGKINHITEGLDSDEAPHPLKTFSNLTSGSLKEGDKIAVANASFFNQIRPAELKTLINSFNPTLTAIECAKILKSNSAHDANAIFLELTNKEDLANIPPEQKVETVYIDQTATAVTAAFGHFISKSVIPGTKRLFGLLFNNAKNGYSKLSPHIKNGFEKTKQSASGAIQNISSKRQDSDYSLTEKNLGGEDYPQRKSFIDKKSFLKFKNKLKRRLIQIGIYTREKSKLVLIVFGVVVVVLAGSITLLSYKHRKADANNSLQTKAQQVANLETQAATAGVRADENAQLAAYRQIVAIYGDLKGTKYENDAKGIYDKAVKMITELSKLTPLNAKTNIELQNVVSLQSCLKQTIALQKDGSVQKVAATPIKLGVIQDFKYLFATCLGDLEQIVVLQQDKSLSIFDLSTKTQTKQSPGLTSLSPIKSFGDNLYQLDNKQNQIWKIVNDNSDYQAPTAFLKGSVSIIDAVDFAIDGSIYTINPEGIVARYSRGEKISDFTIKLPGNETFSTWTGLFTSQNSNSLFAVVKDNSLTRVVEIQKTGDFIAQYTLNGSENSSLITIDADARTIDLYQGSKILEYSI